MKKPRKSSFPKRFTKALRYLWTEKRDALLAIGGVSLLIAALRNWLSWPDVRPYVEMGATLVAKLVAVFGKLPASDIAPPNAKPSGKAPLPQDEAADDPDEPPIASRPSKSKPEKVKAGKGKAAKAGPTAKVPAQQKGSAQAKKQKQQANRKKQERTSAQRTAAKGGAPPRRAKTKSK